MKAQVDGVCRVRRAGGKLDGKVAGLVAGVRHQALAGPDGSSSEDYRLRNRVNAGQTGIFVSGTTLSVVFQVPG